MEPRHSAVSIRSVRVDDPDGAVCSWSIPGGDATVTIPAILVNRLKEQVRNGLLRLPKRGAEVGGILLGRVVNHHPLAVHIADFEPVPCEYRFGPTFVLSEVDLAGFKRLLADLADRRKVSIVGYFRSCTGRDLALDEADNVMMRTYFPNPESVVLSLKPLSLSECTAWFFFRQNGTLPTLPTHPALPFDDRQVEQLPPSASIEAPFALSLIQTHEGAPAIETAPEPELKHESIIENPAEPEPIEDPQVEQLPPPAFTEAPVTLALIETPERAPAIETAPEPIVEPEPEVTSPRQGYSLRPWHWITLIFLLAFASAAGYYLGNSTKPAPPPTPSPIPRPNPDLLKKAAPPALPPAPAKLPATPAALLQQAEPDISPGIRARILSPMVVNVDVQIDAGGRVIAAAPKGTGDTVFRFLAEQAAAAARASRFRPARAADGTPVASTATLSFAFDPPPH